MYVNRSTPNCIALACLLYVFKLEINIVHTAQKECQILENIASVPKGGIGKFRR